MAKKAKKDVYQIITDRIIKALEDGVVPWEKPWNVDFEMPKNLISKKVYRGMNVLLLGWAGYSSPYWLTFKQCKKLGGTVRKGEKGMPITFWKMIDKTKKDKDTGEEQTSTFRMLRYYTVFNTDQCEGLEGKVPEPEEVENEHTPIEVCEQVVKDMPLVPVIRHGGSEACYWPSKDEINMPKPENFKSPEEYYSTLFHELGHSTGHQRRLDRHRIERCTHKFGSKDYSKEELVAELTASFICGVCKIDNKTVKNSEAYIGGWLKKLESDPKFIVQAAGKAQKAADYILGIEF